MIDPISRSDIQVIFKDVRIVAIFSGIYADAIAASSGGKGSIETAGIFATYPNSDYTTSTATLSRLLIRLCTNIRFKQIPG